MQICGEAPPTEQNSRDSNHAPHGWNINVDDVVERSTFDEICQLQDTIFFKFNPTAGRLFAENPRFDTPTRPDAG